MLRLSLPRFSISSRWSCSIALRIARFISEPSMSSSLPANSPSSINGSMFSNPSAAEAMANSASGNSSSISPELSGPLRTGTNIERVSSFLSRTMTTDTFPFFPLRSASRQSELSEIFCSPTFTITSPARRPAVSAALPFCTERTSMPSPFLTPK